MKNSNTILIALLLFCLACKEQPSNTAESSLVENHERKAEQLHKIPILNFATFHFGSTSDAMSTEFDEHSEKNRKEAHEIAKKLSEFKPTVILVELIPERNEKLLSQYGKYLSNPKMDFKSPSEVELLAYELGRISGVKRIYGIDHKMEYNYRIGSEIINQVDSVWYNKYYQNIPSFYPNINFNEESLSLLDRLKTTNRSEYLDLLIAINADMLTHAGSENGFEGADEASKFYQRNLRMYSNLNRIELNEDDRVFILMGGAHTAFFRDFINRSPKYKMVDTFEYLN
ncbi:DUF5694 domain-containing protein [Sediminitomix flava]|uniref:Uncharacterized protein n=1 Tax=Sediminitomix flava TaxID=379075 RepID=A0A315ZD44_SEDFL|nr:DUF5694 domain-containing protein [Sediminitomix flava]PWJ43212.1 hypothetical protein BC781_102761 [Sediminitomix flava]